MVATLSMSRIFLWTPYIPARARLLLPLDFFVMWAAFADFDRNSV